MFKGRSACIVLVLSVLYLHGATACLSQVAFGSRKSEPVAPSISLLTGGAAAPSTPLPPTSWSHITISRTTPASPSTTTPKTTTTTTRGAPTSTTTARPNITFPVYNCQKEYEMYYCMNSGNCFVVLIEEATVHGCECKTGFFGQRCEYKEFDGSFIPRRPSLEEANPEGALFAMLVFIFVICIIAYFGSLLTMSIQPEEQCKDAPIMSSLNTQMANGSADDICNLEKNADCCGCMPVIDWCCCCREIYEKLQNVNKLAKNHYLVKKIKTYANKNHVRL